MIYLVINLIYNFEVINYLVVKYLVQNFKYLIMIYESHLVFDPANVRGRTALNSKKIKYKLVIIY